MPCAVEQIPRITHNGIETTSVVTYQGWEPGKEYTKNIVLKNVKVKTQKLTYNSPSSRFFSTLYPKQITLSAGTSFVLPVTFRPLEKNIYEDQICFASKEGDFSIPIKAVLPVFDIKAPDELEFPICAVKDEVQLNFTIQNKSELTTPFKWDFQEPFSIEPSHGIIQPFGNQKLTVFFHPTAAQVYQCEAKCLHGSNFENCVSTVFKGTGKYPHLLVSTCDKPYESSTEISLDFGVIPIGSKSQKMIEIFNRSPVEAKCTIQQPSKLTSVDHIFSCQSTNVVVPSNNSVQVPITYSPINVHQTSTDYLYISTISNICKMTIRCQGHSTGPDVKLSTNVISFSLIDVGESATRTFEITNNSAAFTSYQFKIDCKESVFQFDTIQGELKPGETRKVIVKFWPRHAINYYRCVYCVVDNQAPIYLQLIGTAHSETVKPAVLEIKHLSQFRKHMERGLSMFPPEQLNEMLANGKLEVDSNNTLLDPLAESIEPWLNPVPSVPDMDLYFNDGYHSDIMHSQPHVSLDVIHVDFGRVKDLKNIEPQTIRLTNHTRGKIIAQWMGDSTHTFHIMPSSMEIPPLKTADFRVIFQPEASNNFYGNELECFCYYKSLRDYRLVESLTHAPPICVTLTAVANTFQQNQTTYIPQISFSQKELLFPATNQNEPSYKTLIVTNKASTPILYEFPDNEIFSVKPKKGFINNLTEIFVVKALPKKAQKYKSNLNMMMNCDSNYTQTIPAVCTAETAELLLSSNGEMFFKQTCVGTASSQQYIIKNISRMPLEFKWSISSNDNGLIKVEPSTGVILPNENQHHKFTFTPKEETHYVMKPTVIVTAQGQSTAQSGGKPKAFPVRAIGHGATGHLSTEEAYVDFGNVIVGSTNTQVFNVCNDSDCSLRFMLSVDQQVEGHLADGQIIQSILKLDVYEGEIPARSKQTIRGVVKPLLRCQYTFTVSYELITPEAVTKVTEKQELIKAYVTGVFPLMAVTDARIHGSGIGISKKQLWSLFQLDNLNMFLDSDPSERELMYSVQTRNSTRRRPPVLTRAIIDFNFGAAPVDSDPCYVTLHVENTGTVDCEWEFLFPSDLQIDLEYWSENGDYTQDELHEMKVMDNKLFNITPKKGKLAAGETCAVTFTYDHLMAGTDRVPVLLKLSRGREILINCVGVTVEGNSPYIHFPSNSHHFAPVAIGEKECPKQLYEMYNGGSTPVEFEIDTLPLDILRSENFDHKVFTCLNPKGVIQPGSSHTVEWMFYPLEARSYQVDVPIHISKGDTALITFHGVGYDKKQMGDTMPTATENTDFSIPNMQTISVPGQRVVLSEERVSFGNLPLFCNSRKVVFMKNTSDHVVSFSWHVTKAGDQKISNVYPAKGVIQPGGSQMVKVSFTSTGEPTFYDMDVVCEIVDETDMAQYRRQLRDWENERERQIYEFTITEKDLVKEKQKKMGKKGVPSNTLMIDSFTEGTNIYTLEKEEKSYKPYRTLPPILDRSADIDRSIAAENERLKAALWQRPAPPKPFLIHLGVTARTHAIATFQEQFFEDMETFFIDKTLSETDKKQNYEVEMKESEEVICSTAEGDLLAGVISNILRTLVDDASFHQSVTKLSSESTPYFSQCKQLSITNDTVQLERTNSKPMTATLSSENNPALEGGPVEAGPPPDESHPVNIVRQKDVQKPTNYSADTSSRQAKSTKSDTKVAKSVSSEEKIYRSPLFANIVEDVLDNTLMNILLEAATGEFNITARPRLIALPPRKGTTPKDKH